MTAPLTCTQCGHQGYDVLNRIVRVDDPNPPSRETGYGYAVPERFRREARCIDREACEERAASRGVR